jgi:sugar lactone lactonase YvrE
MELELLSDARAQLGEGPVWHAREKTLYWVDILGKRVCAGTDLLVELMICHCLPRRSGGLPGLGISFMELDPITWGRCAAIDEPAHNRVNDGKCDHAGRFLVGTMDRREQQASGTLYSVEGNTICKLLSGIRISNGLTWSPDYKTLYYIDTPTRLVQAFDYDLASGEIMNGHTVIRIPESLGWPDGMTSDSEGRLWIAMWGGAQVTRWDASSGELLERIPLPALQVSSCIFGGVDLNELYITSARTGLTPGHLAAYPLSGGLFRLSTRLHRLAFL